MLQPLDIKGTSLRVSEMAFGAMLWGTVTTLDESLRLYDAYREAGGNVLDTAHVYAAWQADGLGVSERTLGKVLKARGDREQVVIMSKGGHPAFGAYYTRPDRYISAEVVGKDITESLERLGVECIDMYLLHRDDRRVGVDEIVGLLNAEVGRGRIRYFGVSNWRPARVEEANRYAAGRGLMGFVASQPRFSLAAPNTPQAQDDMAGRFLVPEDLAWHEKTQFPAFCYSPTAQGYFATSGEAGGKSYECPLSRARLERAREFAAKRGGGTTANQVALSWMRAQGFPAIPLLGTTKMDHLNDALAAVNVRLTREEARWLSNG